ncbi:MAG: hypothetical protein DLM67_11080 [Candidatus Nephthysia bennettiae]|nr:MAG: hypothetical protein DLM67_11080 [Candidatus Dormibacteraeota bacterium]
MLSASDYFEALAGTLVRRLPGALRDFEAVRGRGRLLKLDYGHPVTHFEAWHHRAAGRLEVGLHFEGERELNAAAHVFFRGRIVEIKRALPRAELEPWDRGWARLYETVPAPELSDRSLGLAVERLTAYVTVLQPMLTEFWESR